VVVAYEFQAYFLKLYAKLAASRMSSWCMEACLF